MKYIAIAAIPLMAASLSTQAATTDQVNKQIQKLNQRIAASEQRFRINGFASFGISQGDEDFAYNGINNDNDFRQLTKSGIQMTFNLDDKTSVVTQLVSRGINDFKTNMEWAYLKHDIGNGLSTKFGRFRGPYYLLSEYLDIGYAVPWTQMPPETYALLDLFSSVEGADLTWETEIADFDSQLQVVYGRITNDDFNGEDAISIGYTLSGDTWSARIAHSQATIHVTSTDMSNPLVASSTAYQDDAGVEGTFDAIGARWEPGNFLVMAEMTTQEAPGVIQDEDSYYMTVGYRMGQWMPHLTFAHAESTDDEDRSLEKIATLNGMTTTQLLNAAAGGSASAASAVAVSKGASASNNTDTDRIGLGVRYDVSSGVAMKLQYDMISVNNGSPGLFDPNAFVDITGGTYADVAGSPDSANILTFTIDTVF